MRFLHIADVHLDTPFASRSEPVRDRLRQALRDAFSRCVDVAEDEEVDAVLVAGDLFDGGRLSFETERFLLEEVGRLDRAGIQFVYATGNHDPGAAVPDGALEWPSNATVIGDGEPRTVEVRRRDGEVVGWVTAAGHATAHETDDLSRRMRPRTDTPRPQVGLLHTLASAGASGDALAGASGGAGGGGGASGGVSGGTSEVARVHRPYAPSRVADLQAAGFHYWALGHVHVRQELSAEPPVWYSGNIQGRNPAETGPKGGLLVDLSDPEHPLVEFRELAAVRWERLTVSGLEGASTLEQLVAATARKWEAAREADPGADVEWVVAVELEGPSPLWAKLRERAEMEMLEDEIARRMEFLGVEARAERLHPPVRLADHAERRDVLGTILQLAAAVAAGEEDLGISEGELAGYDWERDGKLGSYLAELMKGGAEEVAAGMLNAEGGAA